MDGDGAGATVTGHTHIHAWSVVTIGGTSTYTLLREHLDDFNDWPDCGAVAPPGMQCTAWSVASVRQCPKRAAVVLDTSDGSPFVALCGGHLSSHRKRDLRVMA